MRSRSKAPIATFLVQALILGLVPGALLAAADKPAGEAAEKPPIKWDFSGEARLRPEYRDDLDLRPANDDLRQLLLRLRLGAGVTFQESYRIFIQAQDSRVMGEESSTASNTRNLDLHQGYFEARRLGVDGLGLTAGRQEWKYGEERMIGAFNWDNVGRAFDGLRVTYERDRYSAHGFAARVRQISTVVVDPGGTPARTHSEGSDLYGAQYLQKIGPKGEYGGYWLEFLDNVSAEGELFDHDGDPNTAPIAHHEGETAIHAIGLRMKDSWGRFDLNIEIAGEKGVFRGDSLHAAAGAVVAGASCGEKIKARSFVGFDYATGDADPSDGRRQEFFNFFPTNHPLYGYADLEGWRNLRSPYTGVSVSSGRHWGVVKYHRFLLEEERGAWKDAGGNVLGADASGTSGRNVGGEFDLLYRFSWFEKGTVEVGYSRFAPGLFAQRSRGGVSASDWAYAMLTVGF